MSHNFINAAASSRGNLVAADAGIAGATSALFSRVRRIAHSAVDTHFDGLAADDLKARFDSAVDKLTAQEFGSWSDERMDSIGAEGGALLAGKLRQVIQPVLEETRPLPNGLRLFNADTTVQLGAKSFEVQRFYAAGSARVWGGSESELPTNTFGVDAQEFQIRNYVTSVIYDVFEEMNASFANLDMAARMVRIARDTLERFTNEMTWFGDSRFRIHGVFNYPWLDKELSGENFYGTPADTRTVLTVLNEYMNRQHTVSKGTMGPNRVVTSPRVADWIMQTPMGTSTSMRDRTIGEVWMAGQKGRLQGEIERAWECQDVIAEGYDAMLFYRSDDLGIKNVIPGGGIQVLPLHKTDLKRRQIFWMAHGGVLMLESGNMLLVFVKAKA